MFEKREINYYHFGEISGESISDISTFWGFFSISTESNEEKSMMIADEKTTFVFKNGEKY